MINVLYLVGHFCHPFPQLVQHVTDLQCFVESILVKVLILIRGHAQVEL